MSSLKALSPGPSSLRSPLPGEVAAQEATMPNAQTRERGAEGDSSRGKGRTQAEKPEARVAHVPSRVRSYAVTVS